VWGLLAVTAPAAAQSTIEPAPALEVRPFFVMTAQGFSATETFKAVFGGSVKPFFGGGAQLAFRNGLYADVTISRFSASGERAFSSNGEVFKLGIPLTATIVPIEVTGGYRFGADKLRHFNPYLGAGFGTYRYTETSDFSDVGDNVDERGSGYLAVGGIEMRIHRWIIVSGDAQYTHVGGILGKNGISQQVGEDNLGGLAARFRLIIGR
jgi:opacity protein-like surface antigen